MAINKSKISAEMSLAIVNMNEFLELANQVNTIVVFDLIVMAGLWVVHDILKDFGSYIKEKIKSTQEEKVE